MLVDVSYIFFAAVPLVCSAWLLFKEKEKRALLPTIGFISLILSLIFQLFSSTWWTYIMQLRIQPRVFDVVGLGFFAAFAISIALTLMTRLGKQNERALQ